MKIAVLALLEHRHQTSKLQTESKKQVVVIPVVSLSTAIPSLQCPTTIFYSAIAGKYGVSILASLYRAYYVFSQPIVRKLVITALIYRRSNEKRIIRWESKGRRKEGGGRRSDRKRSSLRCVTRMLDYRNSDRGGEHRGYEFPRDEAVISINYRRRRRRAHAHKSNGKRR